MRIRFSIRDLLWLTALVALTMGWWLSLQKDFNAWQHNASARGQTAGNQMVTRP
jgi:hypothetical protein